jgi:hypothetical protein
LSAAELILRPVLNCVIELLSDICVLDTLLSAPIAAILVFMLNDIDPP